MNSTLFAVTSVVCLLTLSCGKDAPSTGTASPATAAPAGSATGSASSCTVANAASGNAVVLQNFNFLPACLKVAVGTQVTFTNQDGFAHSVTTDASQVEAFDDTPIAPGAAYQHTFATAGTVKVHCIYHSNMHLTVLVQ
jgi:plastocyanin